MIDVMWMEGIKLGNYLTFYPKLGILISSFKMFFNKLIRYSIKDDELKDSLFGVT